jgi:hypothetical protein
LLSGFEGPSAKKCAGLFDRTGTLIRDVKEMALGL